MLDEHQEFADEILERWHETHKKSMTMLFVLVALNTQAMWSRELNDWLQKVAGVELTERGLHRVMQRMHSSGLIDMEKVQSPKSGAARKIYRITDLGCQIAAQIKESGLSYWQNQEFQQALSEI